MNAGGVVSLTVTVNVAVDVFPSIASLTLVESAGPHSSDENCERRVESMPLYVQVSPPARPMSPVAAKLTAPSGAVKVVPFWTWSTGPVGVASAPPTIAKTTNAAAPTMARRFIGHSPSLTYFP